MNLTTVVKKFKRNAADYGFVTAVKKGILYPFRSLYESRVYRIYKIDLKNYTEKHSDSVYFTYRQIGKSDQNLIEQIEEMEEWLQGEVAAKLAAGGLCLVALDQEAIAGFNLVSFGKVFMPVLNLHRHFKKGEAWSEQITVHKNYRGKGLGADLRYRVFSELKKLGMRKFYGGTLSDNNPNLQLTRKVGFKEIADIHYFKLAQHKKWSCQRVQ